MKARHKDTGEIIQLAEEGIISSDGRRFCWYQVELIPEPIDEVQAEVSVECKVRVYPTLDNKPRPWVSLYKHGISCDSIRDIPELETLGFKDDDTAIVTIARKENTK